MTDLAYGTIIMVINVLFYIAIVVTVNILSMRINNCIKNINARKDIENQLVNELKSLIEKMK